MLNTQKLLYILPDLAYIAELLPDKKPHTFAIQAFKQVNGDFINESEFISQNIAKLISKLEEGEEYFLILPDFLFTNTIVSIKETSEAKIKETVSEKTLPELGIKEDSHLIETVHLNQLKGTTRVQLSAIEKSVLSVLKAVFAEKDIKIAGVAPLSWAVKSLISLEPSISVLQLGGKLYTAQHYIGVDQTTTADADSPENVIETIKTLKGAEPSIQTVYISTNGIVEDKLKDELSKLLPIQQMAAKDDKEKIPSYVSQVITATMRTLSIPDFTVPTFKLGKPTEEEKELYASLMTASATAVDDDEGEEASSELPKPKISPVESEEETKDEEDKDDIEEIEDKEEDAEETEGDKPQDIENITEPESSVADAPDIDEIDEAEKEEESDDSAEEKTTKEKAEDGKDEDEEEKTETESEPPTVPVITPSISPVIPPVGAVASGISPSSDIKTKSSTPSEETAVSSDPVKSEEKAAEHIEEPEIKSNLEPTKSEISPVAQSASQDIDLKQFSPDGETAVSSQTKPVIKNKSGAHMMKMILITTGVFIVTVAIGIGVGLAILKYSGTQNNGGAPVVQVEQATPTPEATVTPEPAAEASPAGELDKAKLSILVINATTKAGYAGQIKTKLTTAEFESVTTGNAKSEYEEEGNYIYMKEENANLVEAINEATGLEFTVSEDAKAEDPQGRYDAVVVLAE